MSAPPRLVGIAGLADALCFARVDVTSAEAAIRHLARELQRAGHALGTFEAAAVARERRSPTGLPFAGGAVALPHAEPEHVASHAIAIATLARPVKFREMGSPATQLDVGLVVMPALTAREQAAAGLAALIEALQSPDLRAALAAAPDADAMRAALAAVSTPAGPGR
jgi:PTS system galactitol-specific IIA component